MNVAQAGFARGGLLAAGDDQQKAAPLGLFVLLLLGVACYFLFKSMSRHLKRVREDFPAGPSPTGPIRPTRPTRPTRPSRPARPTKTGPATTGSIGPGPVASGPVPTTPVAASPVPPATAEPDGAGAESGRKAAGGVDDVGRRDQKTQ